MNTLGVSHDCIAVVTSSGKLLLRAHLNTARVAGMILLDVPAVRAQLASLHVTSALLERPVPTGSSDTAYAAGCLFGSTVSTLKALGIATRTEMPCRWRDALGVGADVVAAANGLFSAHDFTLADDAIAALLALYGSRLSLHGPHRSADVNRNQRTAESSQPQHRGAIVSCSRSLPARLFGAADFLRAGDP
jgi:hypothetical protein